MLKIQTLYFPVSYINILAVRRLKNFALQILLVTQKKH